MAHATIISEELWSPSRGYWSFSLVLWVMSIDSKILGFMEIAREHSRGYASLENTAMALRVIDGSLTPSGQC